MQHKPDLEDLLERYLNGRSSPEEDALLQRFFEQSGTPGKPASLSEADQARMLTAFQGSPRFNEPLVKKNPLVKIFSYRVWKVAIWQAAAVLLLFLGCWQWGQVYFSGDIVYKQISNPKGSLLKITLPDSSQVILNANSTLRYAVNFAAHRDLQLTGEALFDVSKDKAHPFTIHTTGGLQTTVLGTSFTIRSYDNLPETRVMVISGRVQVQHGDTVLGVLGSNEQVVYSRVGGGSHLETVADAGKQAGWTHGEWEYDNMPVQELQALLFNYYNIHVMAKDAATQHLVANASINFTNRQTAEEIISLFSITANCHYKWLDHATVELY